MEYLWRGNMEISDDKMLGHGKCLEGITDFRRPGGHLLHKLKDVLIIGLTTVVAGWDDFVVMEDFGKAKQSFFKTFLELPNGIPDEKTFARVFAFIDPQELIACLGQWLDGAGEAGGREINIDGKAICGSARKSRGKRGVHIVSAWGGEQNLVLGQVAAEEKATK
jgi:hypothetical protein